MKTDKLGNSFVQTEFVPRCKYWCYDWALQLWLLRLSLYSGVNNDGMNEHDICMYTVWAIVKEKHGKKYLGSMGFEPVTAAIPA